MPLDGMLTHSTLDTITLFSSPLTVASSHASHARTAAAAALALCNASRLSDSVPHDEFHGDACGVGHPRSNITQTVSFGVEEPAQSAFKKPIQFPKAGSWRGAHALQSSLYIYIYMILVLFEFVGPLSAVHQPRIFLQQRKFFALVFYDVFSKQPLQLACLFECHHSNFWEKQIFEAELLAHTAFDK